MLQADTRDQHKAPVKSMTIASCRLMMQLHYNAVTAGGIILLPHTKPLK
jgi:hypothetical protein